MRISINKNTKAIMFWLDSKEAQQPDIMDKANQFAKQYTTDKKYKVVLLRSGNGDYIENAKTLLSHNLTL